ncbi:hypothetical protein dsx2_0295 [Desulfovibrio sp. X2]|uniref:hypothetical protein n=1 Tax=Desulfovibrio sp. X2 TaxID=941449 RepID=UPI000358C9B3|nr:hypothetical protein [Desulfovibrio sp. X2]EPR42368.1 hypothetical protein dsx2_0295 [Desulfovibrio sp. X2]
MRNSFRIDIEDGDVYELAAWFYPLPCPQAIHISELGLPNLLLGRVNCSLHLDNISAEGVGISFRRACRHFPADLQSHAVLLYMKLSSPLDPADEPFVLLLGCTVQAARQTDERVFLGLRVVCEGSGDAQDKIVNFLNVEKYGIADLTRWCDEKDRVSRAEKRAISLGLRMDRLLAEIANAVDPRLHEEIGECGMAESASAPADPAD